MTCPRHAYCRAIRTAGVLTALAVQAAAATATALIILGTREVARRIDRLDDQLCDVGDVL